MRPSSARSLTFNVYAREVRALQAAQPAAGGAPARRVLRAHPALFVGVTLDPDTYINPFFDEHAVVRLQPRHAAPVPRVAVGHRAVRRAAAPTACRICRAIGARSRCTLADASRLAGRTFARWDDVDPPRAFPRDPAHPFWKDPWVHEWETFRRHLVHLHYDELSQWLREAGIPRDRILSSQGFMAPLPTAHAVRADASTSPVKNYDSGGMSVEGAIPRDGHLGAILYGAAAVNDVPMENGRSLFATFAAHRPGLGVVEYNTADLRDPKAQPDYATGYRALRDLCNCGRAIRVADGVERLERRATRRSPTTSPTPRGATRRSRRPRRDFLLSHAGLPLGARLWTFGSPRHVDGDGWIAEHGGAAAGPGFLTITPEAGVVEIVSPGDLGIAAAGGARRRARPARRCARAQRRGARARRAEILRGAASRAPTTRSSSDATRVASLALPATRGAPIDRLKIRIALDAGDARAAHAGRRCCPDRRGRRRRGPRLSARPP